MMRRLLAAARIGLLDMRNDLRRFTLLIICLAVGTALIAGVSSVGASIRQAVEQDAALLMGGDVELSRTDRAATADELALMQGYGQITTVIDTNVRAENGDADAFVDLITVGEGYPLLGAVGTDAPGADQPVYDLLGLEDDAYGALVAPLMLEQLGISVGDRFTLGGTDFDVRGALLSIPDSAVRGFRLGLPVLITIDGLATLSDMTSPLPGLGTYYRYKVLLADRSDPEAGRSALEADLGAAGFTVRSAREGLGPMVRYYDLFMRFLVIVGLASLLIGGVSVWTSISAYITERSNTIAVMRAMGATRSRVFVHFFSQVAALAVVGVGIGVLIGGAIALIALPAVGAAVGVSLAATIHVQPLLVAAGVGLTTAFAFSYLPLQQAQSIKPVHLFRSRGLAAPPMDWRALLGSLQIVPLLVAAGLFFWLAVLMTSDPALVAAFAVVSALAVVLFRVAIWLAGVMVARLPEPKNRLLRYALRGIGGPGSNAPAVVVSVGMALAMLVVVLVLQVNLRNEYLGASVFDAPTLVASDLFDDEVASLEQMQAEDSDIVLFTSTPMLRGAFAALNDTAVENLRPSGPEALFLVSGEIPLTYRQVLPQSSKIVAGDWWPDDYQGPPLVSLHQSLQSGLGIALGDTLTFDIFGDQVTATVANFRDYSWQGGIDFIATFSPGVLEDYPATLLGAITAAKGREEALELQLAEDFPDIGFIAIGATLELITAALGQLSLAASLVGGLAVGNGLLVLIGSLATGRRQRQMDAVINKVLGARRFEVLGEALLHYSLLAAFAAIFAAPLGIALAWILTMVLLDVDFAINAGTVAAVVLGAVVITGVLGAGTIFRVLSLRPARLLREAI